MYRTDANLNEEQLQAKYPEIHNNIRPAIAGNEDNSEQILMIRD
jgi:hypothetical protein